MNALTKILAAACVILIVWLGWVMRDYGDLKSDYTLLKKDNAQMEEDNKQQAKVIATQSFEFNRFNQIATTAYRYGIQTEVKSQEKVIEYREILKKELTCDLPVPQPIADGLLKYTYKLRSMYADPQNTNGTSANTTTTSTLTYCQAVLWIDPLLSALDKANGQLKSIREIDAERENAKSH